MANIAIFSPEHLLDQNLVILLRGDHTIDPIFIDGLYTLSSNQFDDAFFPYVDWQKNYFIIPDQDILLHEFLLSYVGSNWNDLIGQIKGYLDSGEKNKTDFYSSLAGVWPTAALRVKKIWSEFQH